MENTNCSICGCQIIHKKDLYATDTLEGRSHLTKHHLVASRFFNKGKRKPIFEKDPWSLNKDKQGFFFCYECHEELLHNPVLLPNDIKLFSELVEMKGFSEKCKPTHKNKIAGRIRLFHEVIERGIKALIEDDT